MYQGSCGGFPVRVQMGQRAVIYCRVSTADQSCVRQKDELKRFAECADYEVSGVFIETESGGLCCKVGAPVGNRVWFWLGAVVMNDFKRRHFRVDKYGDTIDVYLPPPPERQSCQTFSGQGRKRSERLGKARDDQYGQSTDLWHSD